MMLRKPGAAGRLLERFDIVERLRLLPADVVDRFIEERAWVSPAALERAVAVAAEETRRRWAGQQDAAATKASRTRRLPDRRAGRRGKAA
jgi:hypothetical protein